MYMKADFHGMLENRFKTTDAPVSSVYEEDNYNVVSSGRGSELKSDSFYKYDEDEPSNNGIIPTPPVYLHPEEGDFTRLFWVALACFIALEIYLILVLMYIANDSHIGEDEAITATTSSSRSDNNQQAVRGQTVQMTSASGDDDVEAALSIGESNERYSSTRRYFEETSPAGKISIVTLERIPE